MNPLQVSSFNDIGNETNIVSIDILRKCCKTVDMKIAQYERDYQNFMDAIRKMPREVHGKEVIDLRKFDGSGFELILLDGLIFARARVV